MMQPLLYSFRDPNSQTRFRRFCLALLPVVFSLFAPVMVAADEPTEPDEHSDEILFRVNQVAITRSQIELEFLALVPLESLAQPRLSPTARQALLETTWRNAVREVVDAAILQAQSSEELQYLEFVARIEPKMLNDAVEQSLQELEQRYGGAQLLERQMQRFRINRTQLRQRMIVGFGKSMFLRKKFSTLSRSTPEQQREYYRDHPLEFAQSGKVRLQRLALRFVPGPQQTPAQIEAGIAKIAASWQQAADPDGFAAKLADGAAFLPEWTALVAGPDGDWLAFDKLPEVLREAARQPIGAVLAPVTIGEFDRRLAFQTAGPSWLKPASALDDCREAVLLFRIAEQQVALRTYDEVAEQIRARLDEDSFLAAKHEFLEKIRKETRITHERGELPPISPWLLTLTFPEPRQPTVAPRPTPIPEAPRP